MNTTMKDVCCTSSRNNYDVDSSSERRRRTTTTAFIHDASITMTTSTSRETSSTHSIHGSIGNLVNFLFSPVKVARTDDIECKRHGIIRRVFNNDDEEEVTMPSGGGNGIATPPSISWALSSSSSTSTSNQKLTSTTTVSSTATTSSTPARKQLSLRPTNQRHSILITPTTSSTTTTSICSNSPPWNKDTNHNHPNNTTLRCENNNNYYNLNHKTWHIKIGSPTSFLSSTEEIITPPKEWMCPSCCSGKSIPSLTRACAHCRRMGYTTTTLLSSSSTSHPHPVGMMLDPSSQFPSSSSSSSWNGNTNHNLAVYTVTPNCKLVESAHLPKNGGEQDESEPLEMEEEDLLEEDFDWNEKEMDRAQLWQLEQTTTMIPPPSSEEQSMVPTTMTTTTTTTTNIPSWMDGSLGLATTVEMQKKKEKKKKRKDRHKNNKKKPKHEIQGIYTYGHPININVRTCSDTNSTMEYVAITNEGTNDTRVLLGSGKSTTSTNQNKKHKRSKSSSSSSSSKSQHSSSLSPPSLPSSSFVQLSKKDSNLPPPSPCSSTFLLYDENDDEHINAVHNIVRRDIWEGFIVGMCEEEGDRFEDSNDHSASRDHANNFPPPSPSSHSMDIPTKIVTTFTPSAEGNTTTEPITAIISSATTMTTTTTSPTATSTMTHSSNTGGNNINNNGGNSSRLDRYAGTIGFRCRFCKQAPISERAEKSAVYPRSLERIYLSNIRFQRDHILQCTYIPQEIRELYIRLKLSKSVTRGKKKYWVTSALQRGLRNGENGIVFSSSLPESKTED